MSYKLKKIKTFTLVLLCCIFLSSCNLTDRQIRYAGSLHVYNPNVLTVHYIDVGQGDCELIQAGNRNMLIDAGPEDAADKVISYLKKSGVSTLEYIIETHPHEDHIGGMNLVLKSFNVKNFLAPRLHNQPSTSTYRQLIENIKNKNLTIFSPPPGYNINLTPKIQCTVLAPKSSYYEDLNNYSIVIKLTYNNCKFLFMGDAEIDSENEMLSQGFDLSCNVLKVGHHGSKTSSSALFLKEASPNIAIISCGKNNDFGHPHKAVLDRYKALNCKIYRTDQNGDIVLTADGTTIKAVTYKK